MPGIASLKIWEAARVDLPTLDNNMAAGDFSGLLSWLRENIYRHGQKFNSWELLRRVTGKPLTPEPYLRYPREKFGAIYGLDTRPDAI